MEDVDLSVSNVEASKRTRKILRQQLGDGDDLAVARGEEEERLGGADEAIDEEDYNNEMGNSMTAFNLKDIRDTGKFEGAGYTEGEKRDPWLYMVDETIISSAKHHKEEVQEEPPPPKEELILDLLTTLEGDETVNQAINRFGKVVDAIRKRKRAKKDSDTPTPTKTLDEAKEDLNAIVTTANHLLGQDETAIHTFTTRQLQFLLKEMTAGFKYEIKWEGKEEIHGPFTSDQLYQWGSASYLNTATVRRVGQEGFEISELLKKVFTQ